MVVPKSPTMITTTRVVMKPSFLVVCQVVYEERLSVLYTFEYIMSNKSATVSRADGGTGTSRTLLLLGFAFFLPVFCDLPAESEDASDGS